MKKIILLFWILFALSCNTTAKDNTIPVRDTIPGTGDDSLLVHIQSEKKEIAAKMVNSELTYFVMKAADGKFGYSIFINGNMYIEQTTIPALEGIQGFGKREDAEKVAELVIQKFKEGEMPPTITVEDLKRLNVIPE